MPRYYFDLRVEDSDYDVDSDGVVLRDIDAAEREALRAVGDLLRDHMVHGRPDTFVIQVRNEAGSPVIETSVLVRHRIIQRD
jgi:hypothetical protein